GRVESMVDPDVVLVDVIWKWIHGQIVVWLSQSRSGQRKRFAVENFPGDRVEAGRRNEIARKGWAGSVLRIAQRRRDSGEISFETCFRRNVLLAGKYLPSPHAFVGEKEKGAIPRQRTACRSAELISSKGRLRSRLLFIEEVPRIQFVIP